MARGPLHGAIRSARRRSWVGWFFILLSGLLVTALTAWRPWVIRNHSYLRDEVLVVRVGEHVYALNTASGRRERDAAWVGAWRRFDSFESTGVEILEEVPAWLPAEPFADPARYGLRLVNGVLVFGWPFRCSYSVWGVPAQGGAITHRRAFVVPMGRRPVDELVLGYAPIWSGLLANTLVYGVLVLGLTESVGAIKRARRRKRGRCAWCGYDLVGAPTGACPECGVPSDDA